MKQRIYYDFSKECPELKNRIIAIIDKANRKDKGENVDLKALVSFSLSLIKESHIEDIQKKSLGQWDLINIEFEKFKQKSGNEDIELSEFILKKLKVQ